MYPFFFSFVTFVYFWHKYFVAKLIPTHHTYRSSDSLFTLVSCVDRSNFEFYASVRFILNGKVIPLQAWRGPEGFHEVEAPRFQNNRHMTVVRLSALRTGRLYPQELFLVLISVRGWVNPHGYSAAGGIVNEKFQWHYRKSNPRPTGL